jgi:outer membrane protein TolC
MRMPALILAVMAATLLMSPASPRAGVNLSRKDQTEESAKKIKELQKERIATLKEMADATFQMYKANRIEFREVLEARLLLLKAELDVAEKESDRITLYKNTIDVLKEYETLAARKVEFGRGSTYSVLLAKAMRLEAEINLERAKAKEAKEAK